MKTKPNILFITSFFPPLVGGSANVYHKLCHHLSSHIQVLTVRKNYLDGKTISDRKDFDRNQNFKIKRINYIRPKISHGKKSFSKKLVHFVTRDLFIRLVLILQTLRMIHRQKTHIICLGELYSLSWLGVFLNKYLKLPIIHYIHGEEITAGVTSRLYGRKSFEHLRRSDAVIAVSNFTKNALMEKGVAPSKIFVIQNGVDLDQFSPGPPDRELIEKVSGKGKKIFLTVGRIVKRKGHDKVIQALSKVVGVHPNTLYLIAGTGDYQAYLKKMVEKLNLDQHVFFLNHIPDKDLVKLYRTCDFFIMPNRTLADGDTEGFGLVFLEAGACGKPVIGGNAGGVPDAVIHNETGLLVEGRNIESVSKAMLMLIENKMLSTTLGDNGREHALHHSWAKKADEFMKTCTSLL